MLFFTVILLSTLLLLNMLAWVMGEALSNYSKTEKESALKENFQENVLRVLEIGQDQIKNWPISKDELKMILGNQKSVTLLQEVGVDVIGLADSADVIFQSDVNGRQ